MRTEGCADRSKREEDQERIIFHYGDTDAFSSHAGCCCGTGRGIPGSGGRQCEHCAGDGQCGAGKNIGGCRFPADRPGEQG